MKLKAYNGEMQKVGNNRSKWQGRRGRAERSCAMVEGNLKIRGDVLGQLSETEEYFYM